MDRNRLGKQVQFIIEIDKLKQVLRRTVLTDASRRENSAEHSWHLAVTAMLLCEYAGSEVDVTRVLKMALVHDLVEIDAGDTFCYDDAGNRDRVDRERKAADRIFGLLPADQAADFRALWEEFEARATPVARFAAALDRLQPLLHNLETRGRMWREYGVTYDRVVDRNKHIEAGAPDLWSYIHERLEDAARRGWLPVVDGSPEEGEQVD